MPGIDGEPPRHAEEECEAADGNGYLRRPPCAVWKDPGRSAAIPLLPKAHEGGVCGDKCQQRCC